MTSVIAGAAQAAHSVATAILSTAQIAPGSTIPAQSVKENDADKTIPLTLKGKNIIVSTVLAFLPFATTPIPNRSRRPPCPRNPISSCSTFRLRLAFPAPSQVHATYKSPATSTPMTSSRPRASNRFSLCLSMTFLSPSKPLLQLGFSWTETANLKELGKKNWLRKGRVRIPLCAFQRA